jgi:excisionase family DNA binding protein
MIMHADTQSILIRDTENLVHEVELPTSAFRLLLQILAGLGEGKAVRVVPVSAELTEQEAADFLHVSPHHLTKLLDEGEIPFSKAGPHRHIRSSDVVRYKALRELASRDAMAALAKEAQELGLGYE